MNIDEIQKVLDLHKVWLNSHGSQGFRANLRCADLQDADLRGADLRDAFLRGADLLGADLLGADLLGADLSGANLMDANLYGASLHYANLTDANGLPDISWIKSGCLVELNKIRFSFYLEKEDKYENFNQGSFGVILQENLEDKTFDILVEDRIIRNIPEWVKYSGMKQKQD